LRLSKVASTHHASLSSTSPVLLNALIANRIAAFPLRRPRQIALRPLKLLDQARALIEGESLAKAAEAWGAAIRQPSVF
jgi:hypothetical protein